MEKVILLADPKSSCWEFAQSIKNYIQKQKQHNIPLEQIEISHFRNGELRLHVPNSVRKMDVYYIADSKKDPQEWLSELILAKDLILNASASSLNYVLPNLLFTRQDRKDMPHVPISARAVARSLESYKVGRVITMDIHSDAVAGNYAPEIPVDTLYSFPEVVKYLIANHKSKLENLVVVSPDAGGGKRVEAFIKRLGKEGIDCPMALMYKSRPEAGEVDKISLAGDVSGKDALLVDDIIDSGKTLNKAATELRKKGAKGVYCYGCHGLFTMGVEELYKNFDLIFTSNTHSVPDKYKSDKLEAIDVSPTFAEAIYRAQLGDSISELFD
jgi:ribose-phosphate pyrophosphokinase